jgi:hypothetical protein
MRVERGASIPSRAYWQTGSGLSLAGAIFEVCHEVNTVILEVTEPGSICIRTIPAVDQQDERVRYAMDQVMPMTTYWWIGR